MFSMSSGKTIFNKDRNNILKKNTLSLKIQKILIIFNEENTVSWNILL